MNRRILSWLTGQRGAWAVVVLAVGLTGALTSAGGATRVSNDPTAGLPASAQSTEVARAQRRLPSGQINPALVVYSRPGVRLSAGDLAAIGRLQPRLAALALGRRASRPVVAADRAAAIVSVPLAANVPSARTDASVKAIRRVVRAGLPSGVRAQVTGAAGFAADIDNAFGGANDTLLLTTVAVVALLLLVTYRSPVLWLVPLFVVGLADATTGALLAILSRHISVPIDQATSGIVGVLVFGAGTDYALLLIARYREELGTTADRRAAMRTALRTAGPAIAASGLTVILALLTLLLAQFGGDTAIGVAGAVGVATALAFGLLVLPAALVSLPRGIFWPRVPRSGPRTATDTSARPAATAPPGRIWRRIGSLTARRPWPIIATALVGLAVMAGGLATTRLGLSQAQTFRTSSEAVDGLRTLARSFPAGASDPVAIITSPDRVAAVRRAVARVRGVAQVAPGGRAGRLAELTVALRAAPDTDQSYAVIRALRAALRGTGAEVGGTVATALDTRDAARRDATVIAPAILLVVAIILVVLLRALVAPAVLMATVILSYLAAIGAGSWLFTHVLGYAGLDDQVPLLSFLFLTALGIDYNIFLTTRAREEAARHGTRAGIIDALAATGGVITSAGILLAAVFAVLGVLPVTVLTEIGIIVGLGVLLDTLLVRTVLVPALIQVLGETFWKPGTVARRPAGHRPRVRRDAARPGRPA